MTTTTDHHGNTTAREGCDRCACGAKYWENDRCVSCGAAHAGQAEASRYQADHVAYADAQAEARDFARQFPTPNVLRAIELAEAGRVSWWQIADLFKVSLERGLAEVRD